MKVTVYTNGSWKMERNDLLVSLVRAMARKAFDEDAVVLFESELSTDHVNLQIEASDMDNGQLGNLLVDLFGQLFHTQFSVAFLKSDPKPRKDALKLVEEMIAERVKNLPVSIVVGTPKAEVHLAAPLSDAGPKVQYAVGELLKVLHGDASRIGVVIGDAAVYPGPTIVKIYGPGNHKNAEELTLILNTSFQRAIPLATLQVEFESESPYVDMTAELQPVFNRLNSEVRDLFKPDPVTSTNIDYEPEPARDDYNPEDVMAFLDGRNDPPPTYPSR